MQSEYIKWWDSKTYNPKTGVSITSWITKGNKSERYFILGILLKEIIKLPTWRFINKKVMDEHQGDFIFVRQEKNKGRLNPPTSFINRYIKAQKDVFNKHGLFWHNEYAL